MSFRLCDMICVIMAVGTGEQGGNSLPLPNILLTPPPKKKKQGA